MCSNTATGRRLNVRGFIIFVLSFLVTGSLSAPAKTPLIASKDDYSTASSYLGGNEDDQRSLWDDDNEDFDFGGGVWLKEPPLPSRPTWKETDQSSPLLNDVSVDDNKVIDDNFVREGTDDNFMREGIDDDDDDDNTDISRKQNYHQDFLLLPSHDNEEKRNDEDDDEPKVRHTGHSPLSSPGFVVNEVFDDEDDDDDDVVENYDLVPYAVNDFIDGDDGEEMDDGKDVFGDEREAESKRLFEDRVFLF